jgi:hypothetical protein
VLTEVDFQVELAWSHGRRLAPRISMLSLGDVPPNKPMKLSIRPQGPWCNIDGPTRRRACS